MSDQSNTLYPSFFSGSVSFVRLQQPLCANRHFPQIQTGNIWELIYVNQGSLTVSNGSCRFPLSQNGIFIREFNHIRPSVQGSCHLISFAFSCTSPFLCLLSDQVMQTTKQERVLLLRLLAKITGDSDCFTSFLRPFNAASTDRFLCPDTPASPMNRNRYTEYFLDRLLVHYSMSHPLLPPVSVKDHSLFPASSSDYQYLIIFRYLKKHLHARLSVSRICRDNFINRSRLENIFRQRGWHGVIDCFSHMKIDAAKQMIFTQSMTFSQISAALGYSSVHYFSRQFKEKTKMTPTEYSSFLKAHPGTPYPL